MSDRERERHVGLGSQKLLVIRVIVLILFGAKRLPEFARSLGSSSKSSSRASMRRRRHHTRDIQGRRREGYPEDICASRHVVLKARAERQDAEGDDPGSAARSRPASNSSMTCRAT
ncbi:MAG: hypothetical protein DMD96_05025 [Candidatus Rokuibacteriota bacterium]|nr:MAG: hypothetical protein DMD96_05025 [Candidatus Rokubacteria bacterium]